MTAAPGPTAARGEGGGAPLRRRVIAEDDLPGVAALLSAAFPRRRAEAWRLAFARLGKHEPPPGLPRYGVLLETGGRIVGAVLTVCAEVEDRGRRALRCHLSCWTVEPPYAAHAPLLLGPLLRRPDVTLVNVTPAAHTEAIIAAQGFILFCRGSTLVLPLLTPVRSTAQRMTAAEAAAMPESALLATHLAWGCPCFVVIAEAGALPFVFARPKRLRGVLPASRLLYCRDLESFASHAGGLARPLLRAGILGVLIDAPMPPTGLRNLRGWRTGGTQGRYWRGPVPPRPGDLAYGEHALFPD